jgi:DNA mismatch endonuclease (patch repair protein)
MQRVRSRDTKPELKVRRMVFSMGYRYRLHRADLPGKPDLVFPGKRKVIFVHGCFWHGHNCKSGLKQPKTNESYWARKLQRNHDRDIEHERALRESGWESMTVWECELKDLDALRTRVQAFLEGATDGRT